MASSSSPWQRFLRDLKIEDLLGSGPTEELKADMLNRIIFLNKDETVKDALDVLTRNKIIAAPVYDDENNQFIGFVDMLDLATLCVAHLDRARGNPLTQAEFEQLPVHSVIDLSGRNAWLPLDRSAPLRDLFDALSKHDIHRVPIVDSREREPEKKVLAIITQAEIIRWLWVSRSSPGFPTEALSMTIKDMSSGAMHKFAARRELVLIEDNHSVVAALRRLVEKKVNGLGVVSASTGELVGNVSATDVRVAAATGWQELTTILAKPLHDFLKFKASLMLNINEHASHPHPITVTPEDKLELALDKLATNHVHRVWVVRGQPTKTGTGAAAAAETTEGETKSSNVPLGCISLTDVIHELVQFNA
jgi:CBS domain-containing protein